MRRTSYLAFHGIPFGPGAPSAGAIRFSIQPICARQRESKTRRQSPGFAGKAEVIPAAAIPAVKRFHEVNHEIL